MPYSRAASTLVVSHASIGARPGSRRARVSLARSLVPITKPARRVSESLAVAAISRTLKIAVGVSIIAQMRVCRFACRLSRRAPIRSGWSGVDTLGTRIASGAAATAAVRSSANHGVSMPLTRMNTSRAPKPPAFTAATTWLRAVSLASGATASSRSRITPSAGSVFAFSSARAFEPGM